MIEMKITEKSDSHLNDSRMTLFRFELSRTQSSLFLMLSLIGIFMLSFTLAGEVFLNLFQFIFSTLPFYLAEPEPYHEDYLVYHFWPIIIRIIIYTIFFLLSIYVLNKILRHNNIKHKSKRKIIPQERIVNWLGLKISHGQSLFIFSISLIGILFIVQLYLESLLYPGEDWGLLASLCWIPDGPNQATSHEILLKNVPLAIQATFFLLSIYSLFIVRRGKPMKRSKKSANNYSLLIFILSFIVFVFLLARIFCHLALFNYDFSYLLGISYNAPNAYQNNDFITTLILLFICLALIVTSFLLKEKTYKEIKTSDELSWFHIKLTPYRATILLSAALLSVIFFTQLYLTYIFMLGDYYYFTRFPYNLFHIILIPIILFCYYPIGKILKNRHFHSIIDNIETSGEFKTNWFKFRLDKKNSVILFSVSSGLGVLYIFQLVLVNMQAQAMLLDLDPFDSFLLFSFPMLSALICFILVIIIYTIKKTLPSIKSR